MESICKILENVSSMIYPLRFRQYSDQGCRFVGSDITNLQLRIRMGGNQRKLTIT